MQMKTLQIKTVNGVFILIETLDRSSAFVQPKKPYFIIIIISHSHPLLYIGLFQSTSLNSVKYICLALLLVILFEKLEKELYGAVFASLIINIVLIHEVEASIKFCQNCCKMIIVLFIENLILSVTCLGAKVVHF